MKKKNRIRLYTDMVLDNGFAGQLSEPQSHYLVHVMKCSAGDEILCFNGRDGEFLCRIDKVSKKSVEITVLEQIRQMEHVPDIWLMFAPVKKNQTDFIIQKATELGAARIVPVITTYTIAETTKTERFRAQAIEAAEQCRRLEVPEISEAVKLDKLVALWDKNRKLYFMDETGGGQNISTAFAQSGKPAAILTGPEGGFSPEELEMLRSKEFARGVSMGKRILRAETAAAAALACWQALSGDWKL